MPISGSRATAPTSRRRVRMAKRRAKKPAAAAPLALATEAGITTTAAAASTSHDVEMPTTSDSSNSPAPHDSGSSDEARIKRRKAESTRPRTEPGLREILRLTRDNFCAFEKPPTGARRRCTTRGKTAPSEQQRQPSRAPASSSSEKPAVGPSSPASSSGLSSLASSDAESDSEEGPSKSGEDDKGVPSSNCAVRRSTSPTPATRSPVLPADFAATAEEVALPRDRSPIAATSPATDRTSSSNASLEGFPDQANSNKRRRAPKRPTSEVAMLQRDYFAASQDDLLADSKKKRTRRNQTLAQSALPTSSSSSAATGFEEAALPSAQPGVNVPIALEPVAPAVKIKKRRAESRHPDLPPSELRWLQSDYFAAARQPVQGTRRSHSRKDVEIARRLGTVRATKRARMAEGDAGDADSPPPPPPPPPPPKKRSRTAVSPELVGSEWVSQPGPLGESEEAVQQRDISPELYAPSSANLAPLPSDVPQPVTMPDSPLTIPPDGNPLNASPSIDAFPMATETSSLPKKRERKRPARYADAIDALDAGISAKKPAVAASALASQPGVLENGAPSTSRTLEDDPIPKKPTAPKRGRPPKAVAQVIHPTDPTALTDNVVADRSGPPIRPQDASPLAALAVQADITKPSKYMQPKPLSMARPQKKREKPRTRHAAFDSRETWVKPERDLKFRANGRPPIWCEGRQELCETLDYFKSYQGGHYDLQERCLGYLLDGFGTANDVCAENGKIVISHGGGCSEIIDVPATSGAKGEPQRIFRLKASQTRDNVRMRALFNCKDTKTPVVLLAGTQWPFFPRLKDLGKTNDDDSSVRYAVLGHYLVTHIWAEGETIDRAHEPVASSSATPAGPDFFVRFKVRFEWVPGQGKPWFDDVIGGTRTGPTAALESPDPSSPPMSDGLSDAFSVDSGFVDSTTPPPPSPETRKAPEAQNDLVTCATCERGHPRIYEEDVTCYNEACPNFFRLGGCMPRPDSLTYAGALVRTTDLPEDSLVPEPLCPKTLQQLAGAPSISDFSEQAWRGFGCSACGRLSSRSDWTRLRCSGCGAETAAKGSVKLDHVGRRFGEQWQPRKADIGGPKPAYVLPEFRVTPIEHVPGYEGYMVELLEGAEHANGVGHARVHHLWPVTEAASRSADELFEAYQGEEAGKLFERNRLTRHAAVGALRCQQFTFNAGCHYKHVIGAETYPFPPIEADITNKTATASSDAETIIYAPTCARNGRDHLTNIVNALKGTRYSQYTQFNEILSVAYMSGGRMNYHDDGERGLGPFVASISLGSDALMSFRRKGTKKRFRTAAAGSKEFSASPATSESQTADEARETPIPTLDGVKKSQSTSQRAALKIRLKHGDVMLMEGEEMQRQFEHKVEPEGLRFAATARFIGPDHLQPPSGATATRRCSKKKEAAASTGQGVPSRFAYQDKEEEASDYATIPTSLAGWTLPALPALPSLSLPAASSCTRVSASPLCDSDADASAFAVSAPCGTVGSAAPRMLQEGAQRIADAAFASAAPLSSGHLRWTAETTAVADLSLPPSPAPSSASVPRNDGPPESEPHVGAPPPNELFRPSRVSSLLSRQTPTRLPPRPPPPPPPTPPPPCHPLLSAASTSSVPIDEPKALGPQQNGFHHHHHHFHHPHHPQPFATGGGGVLRLRPVAPPPPRPLMPTVIEPTDPSLHLHLQSSKHAALAPAAQFPREAWNVGARVYAQMAPPPPPLRMNAFDAGASRSSARERKQQDLLRRAQHWPPSSSSSYPMPVANQFIPAATTASIPGSHAAFARRYL